MEDPRYGSGDEVGLTESSDDELRDLVKEYESRARDLMKKKEQKRKEKVQAASSQPQISRSRSPSPVRRVKRDVSNPELTLKAHEEKAVNTIRQKAQQADYLNKFTNKFINVLKVSQKREIDYSEKVFEFENIPKQITKECDEKDPVSRFYLLKRFYTVEEINELFINKKVLLIDQLFAKIFPPLFSEPNYANWILTGIILYKSETKYASDSKKSKYIKLQVGNFMHSVDVMLFGDAYTRYWKLRVGDVIAILNPKVNPFRMSLTASTVSNRINTSQNPKGFNLKLDDNSQCIVEIGRSRDIGFCKSVKKSGQSCNTPINIKKSEYCNFHLELAMRKASSQRMSLNGSVSLKAQTSSDGRTTAMYMAEGRMSLKTSRISTDYSNYRPTQTAAEKLYYSGSSFFNDEYTNPKILENITEKRRKLKEENKDHKLELQLSKLKSQASLSKLGLFNDDISKKASSDLANKLLGVAFNNKAIDQIGFNSAYDFEANSSKC